MTKKNKTPIPDSYWLEPDFILAGEYPGAKVEAEARKKIRAFLDSGITYFIDLTEAHEPLEPYDHLLHEEAEKLGILAVHKRMPIMDVSVPTADFMNEILEAIDEALEQDHKIYIHCWGGVGRTGTVAGCYLVDQGLSGEDALAELSRLRAKTPKKHKSSPETREQEEMIRKWETPEIPQDQALKIANEPLEEALEIISRFNLVLAGSMSDAVLMILTETLEDDLDQSGFSLCQLDDPDLTVMIAFTDMAVARQFAEENKKNLVIIPAKDYLTVLFEEDEGQPDYDGVLFNPGTIHSKIFSRDNLEEIYDLICEFESEEDWEDAELEEDDE